uniref:Uncharacterized protein n=1 Tax=viral metagenome TaxID=1070528 RepID=A0A6H2A4G2_9ZZZZ
MNNKNIESWVDDLTKILKPILPEIMPLTGIWFSEGIEINGEKYYRLHEGMILPGNNKILGCFGTPDNRVLFMNLLNLKTLKLSKVFLNVDLGDR